MEQQNDLGTPSSFDGEVGLVDEEFDPILSEDYARHIEEQQLHELPLPMTQQMRGNSSP